MLFSLFTRLDGEQERVSLIVRSVSQLELTTAATATAAQEKRDNNQIDPHAVGNYDVEMAGRKHGA